MNKIRHVTIALSYLGGAAIIAMTGITLLDIIARNVFGYAVFGTYDIVLITLVVSVYAGMAEAFRQQAHITVDMIDGIRSQRLRRIVSFTAIAVTILVMALLTWLCLWQAYDSLRFGDVTTDLRIPKLLFWIAIIVGLTLSCIVLLLLLVDKVRTVGAPQNTARIIGETQA